MDWKKISSEQRKYIVILVLMTVVGVGLMLVGNGQKKTNEVGELNNPTPLVRESVSLSAEKEKENQLAEVLAAIEGVGKVWVDITFACCGSSLSAFQVQQLLDAGAQEIIIAFDRQFQEIGDDEFKHLKSNLLKIKEKYHKDAIISFIFDKKMITDYKASPIDHGPDIFMKLFKERLIL